MQGGDRGPRWFDVLWRVLRPVAIFLAACLLVVGALSTAVVYCYENFVMPVDENDQTLVPITIERGSSISSIARQLKEADLIRNKGVFQYLADFMGKSGKLKAGDYELSRSMTLTEIMDVLEEGDGGQEVMTFRIIEGLSVEEIGASLVEQGVFRTTAASWSCAATGRASARSTPSWRRCSIPRTTAATISWRATSSRIPTRSTWAPPRRPSSARCSPA